MKIGSIPPVSGEYKKIKTESVRPVAQIQPETDSVEVSPDMKLFAQAFAAARRSMQQQPADHEQKVSRIMQQMREGSYEADIQDVCDKLLR